MAFSRIRAELHELRAAQPGTRFQAGHERTRVDNHALRLALIVVGCTLMLAAMATFWLPGPNFVLVLAGLALVGGQSKLIARALDRIEVAGRQWHTEVWEPYERKRALLAALAIAAALLVAVGGWYAWQRGWVPGSIL